MLHALVRIIRASMAARAVVFGLAYLAGAELGHALSLKSPDHVFATFWPPAGILLAALMLSPSRRWLPFLAAACLANLASDVLLHGKALAVSLGFCVAHCGEACLGAWLLRRFVGVPFTLSRIKEVLGLGFFSALISPLLGAAIGAAVVASAYGFSFRSAWQAWWIADAVGVLIIAPIVFTWTAVPGDVLALLRSPRMVECAALFVGMAAATESVYGDWVAAPLNLPALILPFLLWAGFRFGPPGAATALLVTAIIGLWNTNHGHGPYAVMSAVPGEQLLRSQATLCVMSLCVLVLAAAVAEIKQAEVQRSQLIGDLEHALAEIKTLRGLVPVCAWCKRIRNDQGFWQQLEVYLHAHTEAEFTHGMCPECLERRTAALEDAKTARDEQAEETPRSP
jgi:integral membrane sensor domain MASE1